MGGSHRIGYCCIGRYYVHHCRFINLHTMIKGYSSAPSPARHARVHAVVRSIIRGRVGGEGGGRRLCHGEAGIRLQRRRSSDLGTITPHCLRQQEVITTVNCQSLWRFCCVIKLTERASLFVANGLYVPPIAYKLRSLSNLPCLIIQVAGTPTHGVLVSVSAVVYTRILVSDRIGACPYRPFSSVMCMLLVVACVCVFNCSCSNSWKYIMRCSTCTQ